MKKFAVIVAAGSGSRMGSAVPKQFLQVSGKPVLYHSIKAFQNAFNDINIIVVLPPGHIDKGLEIAETTGAAKKVQVVAGGKTRFQSVGNGLNLVTGESVIFVHDGVRCMVSADLIKRCYQQALEKGSAIPAVTAADTIRVTDGEGHKLIDRNSIKIIQTPQTFRSALLIKAFKQPESPTFTDEASVVEASGHTVHLVEGEYDNIKITRPIDLIVAQAILDQRLNSL